MGTALTLNTPMLCPRCSDPSCTTLAHGKGFANCSSQELCDTRERYFHPDVLPLPKGMLLSQPQGCKPNTSTR